jgi:hypothetical protein
MFAFSLALARTARPTPRAGAPGVQRVIIVCGADAIGGGVGS